MKSKSNFLNEILSYKKSILNELYLTFDILELPISKPVSMRQALANKKPLAVIAEIKKASPANGILRANLNPEELARTFETDGAAAISVLTDEKFFQGSFGTLVQVSKACSLPLLCKDFIIDPIQLKAARLSGASAVLLIAAIHTQDSLKELSEKAHAMGLEVLIEIHQATELEILEGVTYDMIGINNRDLHSFEVHPAQFEKVYPFLPKDKLAICESGIKSLKDIPPSAQAVLIGTGLAQNPNLLREITQHAH